MALLLLATALMGTASSLLHAMAATRAASLQSRAVDLAADLAEQLRTGTATADAGDPADARARLVQSWQQEAARILPLAPVPDPAQLFLAESASPLRASHEVSIRWRDPVSRTAQQLSLPLVLRDR